MELMNNVDKKIYSVCNENNINITVEIIQSILKKGNIHYNVQDKDLVIWQQAFIHESYCKSTDFIKNEKFFGYLDVESDLKLHENSNEVFEWLGDAIIQSIIAIYLTKRFKNQYEGFLTKIRSRLVKTETLSKLALYLNFDKYLIISKHVEIMRNGRKNVEFLEDCFEAFIGAMMTIFGNEGEMNGFVVCNNFLISIIEKNIDITELIIHDDNFKDQLMRFYQKKYNGKFPIYEQLKNTNNSKNSFHMVIRDNNTIIGTGIAKSKKEAQQKAAKSALMYFGISNNF
jgi:ribonuclease-3